MTILNRIYTIGHSTSTFELFAALLHEHAIGRLADIRRYPGSRRYPHFGSEALAALLRAEGIEYVHLEDLGGRRKPRAESRNGGLISDQFRGYADHMATPAFAAAIERLLGSSLPTAIMCAEAVPWRCHRNLLSDELIRRGVEVVHLLGPGSTRLHAPHPLALFEKDRVVYPPEQPGLFP